jgi:hypothetical protein
VKSFRVYFRLKEPALAPERCVEQIPRQEQERLREFFVPAVKKFRRISRVAMIIVGGCFICVLLCFVLPKQMFGWLMAGFLICWLALASVIVMAPALRCPACGNDIQNNFGPYCPECSARSLQPAGWFRAPHCQTCGRDMRRNRTRHYRIRACTHCGLWLDDKGL